ncbi:MAG: class I SAM-dependent methyltransferase, partial [Actinomycetes bacterium]
MTNQASSFQPGPARLSQGPSGLILGAFFLPRGLPGRLGGVLMARSPPQQREIADLLAAPGTELCEVGCGPVLAALLAQRHPQRRLHLVDPSPAMRSQAADRARQWQRAGRVDISAGTADQIPLPDAACDTVV